MSQGGKMLQYLQIQICPREQNILIPSYCLLLSENTKFTRQYTNQPTELRTKKLVELNDDLHETYRIGSQIRFKTSMHIIVMHIILASGTISVPNTTPKLQMQTITIKR